MRFGTHRSQRGITLIEIILWSAIVALASAGIFTLAKRATVVAAVEKEQRQVADIVKAVDSIFALQPNFAALGTNGAEYLSTRGAQRAGLDLIAQSDGTKALETKLGSGQLNLAAWTVDTGPGPAIPNGGYRLAYAGLSANECSRLVTATYPVAHKVSIGKALLDDAAAVDVALRGSLTAGPDIISTNCGEASPTVFLYFAPARAIFTPTPAAPAGPAPVCEPTREVQQVPCPAGQIGTITQERTGDCSGINNAFVYTAWATISDTCGATVTAPPTLAVTPAADSCTTVNFSEVGVCPAGQTGQLIRARTLDTCTGAYTPWVVDAALSNCQTMPAATCVPQDDQRTIACAPGQSGSIIQSRSSTCATPTSTPIWSAWETFSNTCRGSATCAPQREVGPIPCATGYYGPWDGERERFRNCTNATTQSTSWTAWATLTPNTSCTACPATTTESAIQWEPRSAACASGEVGSRTWEAERVQTRQASYNCPAGTTVLPSVDRSAWTAWADTGNTRNHINTCVKECSPPAASTETRTSTSCPSGTTGVITEQRTTSWTCPDPASAPTSTTSAWVVVSNTCATNCVAPAPEWRPAPYKGACPTGMTGTGSNWTTGERRTWTCPSPTGSPTTTGWVWDGTPGVFVDNGDCATNCVAPAPTTENINGVRAPETRTIACPAGQSGTHNQSRTVSERGIRTTTWTCPGPTSSVSTSWTGVHDFGAWTTTSNTCATNCVVPSPSTQTNTQTRTATQTLPCPAGQSGAITQSRSEVRTQTRTASCPTATGPVSWTSWSTWSAWTGTSAWVTTSNTCAVNCVAPAPTTENINGARAPETRTIACPAGQSGTHNQSRTVSERGIRTTTWTCPGPTSSVSTSWTGVHDFGAWTTTSNTCATNCVLPSPSTQTNTETRTATQTLPCPAGQSGAITQSRSEVRTQTRTASCPSPTGPVSWTSWSTWSAWTGTSAWVTTSNTCAVIAPCHCSGSLYSGGAYFDSFGSFPSLAACNAAKTGGQVCEAEESPFPPATGCYHLMRTNWRSNTPAKMYCEHI